MPEHTLSSRLLQTFEALYVKPRPKCLVDSFANEAKFWDLKHECCIHYVLVQEKVPNI